MINFIKFVLKPVRIVFWFVISIFVACGAYWCVACFDKDTAKAACKVLKAVHGIYEETSEPS